MAEPSGTRVFPLRETIFEARFPQSFRFRDVVGHLAERIDLLFERVYGIPQVVGDEILVLNSAGEPRMRFTQSMMWGSLAGDSGGTVPEDGVTSLFDPLWKLLQEALDLQVVERLGLRSVSLLLNSTVEEAVENFRAEFFDYTKPPLNSLGGEPEQVQAVVQSKNIRSRDDLLLSATLRLSPFRVLPAVAEELRIGLDEWSGGWLLDLDAWAGGLEASAAPQACRSLFETSLAIVSELSGLSEGGSKDAVGA